jgi:hypothetical protein
MALYFGLGKNSLFRKREVLRGEGEVFSRPIENKFQESDAKKYIHICKANKHLPINFVSL